MKKKIALVTGGYSEEYEVSIKSARTVIDHIDHNKYDVYTIVLTRESWYFTDAKNINHEVNRGNFSLFLNGNAIKFDTVFICLHGLPGEDGRLQGFLDLLDIPYTSCGHLTSALTTNKAYAKAIVADIENLNVAKSVLLREDEELRSEFLQSRLKFPWFIKPNNGGSSIGMSMIETLADLEPALKKAFTQDDEVLIEEFIEGREFSVGIFKSENKLLVLPSTEVITDNLFFDFEAKYTAGKSTEITPAKLTEQEHLLVEKIVKAIYLKLNCRGVVRVDYFLEHQTGRFFFVEINTIPGQTEQSFIPAQITAAGLTLKAFYTDLIESALSDHQRI